MQTIKKNRAAREINPRAGGMTKTKAEPRVPVNLHLVPGIKVPAPVLHPETKETGEVINNGLCILSKSA
jgi:hypothetical protein